MSVFLQIPESARVASNELAFAIRDRFPVSPGHTLVITRRVVPDWFAATPAERDAVMALVDVVKAGLDEELAPDGYNVGFNAGAAAGQTVPHLHVHVIPRFAGDVEDPRGGVRYVVPDKANYLRLREDPLTDGERGNDLLRALLPLLPRASRVDVLAAFVQGTGLDLVEDALQRSLHRGAGIRVLTGDYLEITQADALRRLLDWTTACEAAGEDDDDALPGRIEARVVEADRLGRAFHPKAWRIEADAGGVAFVGSSNLSRSALVGGIEWNLRVDRHRDPVAWGRIAASFERLWQAGTPLSAEWVEAYARRARDARPLPPGELVQDAIRDAPTPSEVQRAALAALDASRDEGRRRALVVLATGLGKTFLAAFDLQRFADRLGRRPRVLFVAHLREILTQAAGTVRRVWPDARFAWFFGGRRPEGAYDVLFASVQSLTRHVHAFDPTTFDYIVVDEVHHADARSYRRVLAHFEPAFLLGLTATPNSADQGDVLGLFDDHVACEVPLGVGVERALLAPFRYFGLKDTTDYAPIPWRGGRFDAEALSTAVQTQQRMERMWEAWRADDKRGTRTLVFCASIAHAAFVGAWLGARGVRVAVVHSGPDSDDRLSALRRLEAGELDAIASVDLFNEGIDCKPIDRVVMLRPTESSVVFLQQLGRGLRKVDGKDHLVVIDFVGNHRVFLDRVRTLLSLAPSPTSLSRFLRAGEAPALPRGCTLDVELEAIALLERLLPSRNRNEVARTYQELRAARGERPLAGEIVRSGLSLASLRAISGSWFGFVAEQGDLGAAEARAWEHGRAWLVALEKTAMTKCFQMVVLEVLLEGDALFDGVGLDDLAARAHAWLLRNPELLRDIEGVGQFGDPRRPDPAAWRRYWDSNPVQAWVGSEGASKAWFSIVSDRFVPRFVLPVDARDAFVDLTRELVDARLAELRRRSRPSAEGAAFEAKAIWNQRDPILKLPDGHPVGEIDVRLPDGAAWRFRFSTIACNVARPVGTDRNGLPDLLRRWFGPLVGRPGTDFRVRFFRTPDGWAVEPLGAAVVALPERGRVVAFPSLRAAAGSDGELSTEAEAAEVALPRGGAGVFAVRAAGDSMDGGAAPIRDGDWVLLRWARGLGIGAVEGRVALVAVGDPQVGQSHHLKRVVRDGDRFVLRSDNPAVAPMPADDVVPIARWVATVRPEDLAPAVGEVADVADAFGISEAPSGRWSRIDGHLFVQPEAWAAPDRAEVAVPDRRPGETAFVLARRGAAAVYLGVGRWRDGRWAFPAMDYDTWRAVSGQRSASRTLDGRWVEVARARVVAWTAGELPRDVEARGKRCRVVGAATRGGVRIDGGPGGFAERTVSVTDLAWALAAEDDVRRRGGVLDEARVNRLRYLDGTPRNATRWIDTGWALVLLGSAERRLDRG